MTEGNGTLVTHFILAGLTDSPDLQLILFIVFLFTYAITLAGNLGMIVLIRLNSQLHTPMYFFLSNLSFIDLSYSSVITPATMMNLLTAQKTISFFGCFTQMYFFVALAGAECFLLAVMAYDRYVAICIPLLYMVVVSWRVCAWLLSGTYVVATINSLVIILFVSGLPFCKSNLIHHFFCDTSPILSLSCKNTLETEIFIYVLGGLTLVPSLIIIFVSYVTILSAVLKMHSKEGRKKAFSTCGSHLMGVMLFYGTMIFTYLKPSKSYSLGRDQVASVFYTIVVPMLNPLIYSLRNKEVKNAFKQVINRKIVHQKR
ncbi:olfactory receptor 8H1-like [Tachyglossus aculeatus]|uniref:olfactory receptor 8H1-like n=1 Tax=Tachyglossus aculeatus TaxID=9261 RepID=UPI0018F5BF85|nr:olfactory receptor 8H1-like [Tachyglossus aculeatus]